jgi:hypothetical protein
MAQLNYRQIREALANREPFKGNSMSADYVDTRRSLSVGRLPEQDARFLESDRQAAHDQMESMYVVWSYSTPIAWAYGDTVRVPDVKYSRTTSGQQTLARVAL